MSVDSEFLDRVLQKLKDNSPLSRKSAATVASGADDGSGIVARALVALLEDEKWNSTYSSDPDFGLIIGRSLVGLAQIAMQANLVNTRTELVTLASAKVRQYIASDDFQIQAHAVFAHKILLGDEPPVFLR